MLRAPSTRGTFAIPIDQIEASVLRHVAVLDAVGLVDHGTSVVANWKGRRLGLVRRSYLIRVRAAKAKAGQIARFDLKPASVWIALG